MLILFRHQKHCCGLVLTKAHVTWQIHVGEVSALRSQELWLEIKRTALREKRMDNSNVSAVAWKWKATNALAKRNGLPRMKEAHAKWKAMKGYVSTTHAFPCSHVHAHAFTCILLRAHAWERTIRRNVKLTYALDFTHTPSCAYAHTHTKARKRTCTMNIHACKCTCQSVRQHADIVKERKLTHP